MLTYGQTYIQLLYMLLLLLNLFDNMYLLLLLLLLLFAIIMLLLSLLLLLLFDISMPHVHRLLTKFVVVFVVIENSHTNLLAWPINFT